MDFVTLGVLGVGAYLLFKDKEPSGNFPQQSTAQPPVTTVPEIIPPQQQVPASEIIVTVPPSANAPGSVATPIDLQTVVNKYNQYAALGNRSPIIDIQTKGDGSADGDVIVIFENGTVLRTDAMNFMANVASFISQVSNGVGSVILTQ